MLFTSFNLTRVSSFTSPFFFLLSKSEYESAMLQCLQLVGSITINSEKIQVSMESPVIETHLNHAVGPWPLEMEKKHEEGESSEEPDSDSLSSSEEMEDASKFMRIRMVGSVAINFISFVGYAQLDVSFDASSGNISFVATEINHPSFMFHGVSFIFVSIGFLSVV